MKYLITIIASLFIYSQCSTQINQTILCIQEYLHSYKNKISSKYYDILLKAFPNTITTTLQHYDLDPGNQSTYIITGDIQAMWLRDSTNQFIPYIRMPVKCPHLSSLTKGLINTQAEFLMIDSYTNAFKKFEKDTKDRPSYLNDESQKLFFGIPVDLCRKKEYATASIWQRKFEIDSPAAFLRLLYEYHSKFNDLQFININVLKAIDRILTLINQQTKDTLFEDLQGQKYYTFYRFSEELPNKSIKFAVNTGMIKTGFRPSDSPNMLPYNVPGNAMLATFLRLVATDILSQVAKTSVFYRKSQSLSERMMKYADSIELAVYKHGVVREGGMDIFAYQVDGMGNYRTYDDANLPSLLSLPYLGFVKVNEKVYQNTRKFILSQKDEFFYSKGEVSGVGSSHTPKNYIWPLALMTQIMTSQSNSEITNCLQSLLLSAKDNLMHESFSVQNPRVITRDWFAWANSFFGEMIMHLAETNPSVLQ